MLILVRHGRTGANAAGLLQGRADHPLDEIGRRQVDRVGTALAAEPVVKVVSSPLRRARDTAAAVAERHGVDVEIDQRFIELDYGGFDGAAMSDVDPATWRAWREDPDFRPPGGESLVELDARVRPALEELWQCVTASPGGAIVVVSHVSPIKSALVWALGGSPAMTWRLSLDRASVSRIVPGATGPTVSRFNDTSHLPADLAK